MVFRHVANRSVSRLFRRESKGGVVRVGRAGGDLGALRSLVRLL
jgi:hypothetical protein